jgi:DNA gyrase/topoisomerase IV subunit A
MGKTNAELQADLDKANAEIKRLSAEPGDFEKLNEHHHEVLEKVASLEGELTTTREKLAAAESLLVERQKDLSDAQAIIEEQHKALSTEDTHSEGVIITVDKKKYKVVAPSFNVAGVAYAAADLKENKELAAKLVANGSSVLQLLS